MLPDSPTLLSNTSPDPGWKGRVILTLRNNGRSDAFTEFIFYNIYNGTRA
jgi:hypothetical protein